MVHVSSCLGGTSSMAASFWGFGNIFGSSGGGGTGLEFRDYYSAACPHCVDLDPAWKEAANSYHGPVTFRQIECRDNHWAAVPENQELCKGINGFPTIKLSAGTIIGRQCQRTRSS